MAEATDKTEDEPKENFGFASLKNKFLEEEKKVKKKKKKRNHFQNDQDQKVLKLILKLLH